MGDYTTMSAQPMLNSNLIGGGNGKGNFTGAAAPTTGTPSSNLYGAMPGPMVNSAATTGIAPKPAITTTPATGYNVGTGATGAATSTPNQAPQGAAPQASGSSGNGLLLTAGGGVLGGILDSLINSHNGGNSSTFSDILGGLANLYGQYNQTQAPANAANQYMNLENQGIQLQKNALASGANYLTQGGNNATQAQAQSGQNAVGQIQQGVNQAVGQFQPYMQEGTGATAQLMKAFGMNPDGSKATGGPDYSGFVNNPGIQYATQLGQQAINRQAAAGGNLYSTNTLANLGNYTQGMAYQNYNNYVQNLMNMAGMGQQAAGSAAGIQAQGGQAAGQALLNSGLAQGQTLENIANAQAQLEYNSGASMADSYTNLAKAMAGGTAGSQGQLASLLQQAQNAANQANGNNGYSQLLNAIFGKNSSGQSNIGSAVSSVGGLISKLFGGGNNSAAGGTSANAPNFGSGYDVWNGAQNGTVDPTTGIPQYLNSSNGGNDYSWLSQNPFMNNSQDYSLLTGNTYDPLSYIDPSALTGYMTNPYDTSGSSGFNNPFMSNDPYSLYDPNNLGGASGSSTAGATQTQGGNSGVNFGQVGSGVSGAGNLISGIQQGGVGGTLQAANGANQLAKATGNGSGAVNGALGTANDLYSLYNLSQHPSVGSGLGGVAAANDLYSKINNGQGFITGAGGQLLSGAGDIYGIYNAIKNPTVGNVASGAIDAYKLYNTAKSAYDAYTAGQGAAAGAGSAAGGSTGALAGAAGGLLGGALMYGLSQYGSAQMSKADQPWSQLTDAAKTTFTYTDANGKQQTGNLGQTLIDEYNQAYAKALGPNVNMWTGDSEHQWQNWFKVQQWLAENPNDPLAKVLGPNAAPATMPQSKTGKTSVR